jgi:hypothetical protein
MSNSSAKRLRGFVVDGKLSGNAYKIVASGDRGDFSFC